MTLPEFLTRFPRQTKVGDQVNVRCPAHEDKTASLTVGEGSDGRVLLHCKAGCTLDAILARLELTKRDLFSTVKKTPAQTIVATYDYTDETGTLRHQAVRFTPKVFKQRRPNGKEWIWNLTGVERVLYRLPALQNQSIVYIVEGEKDADRLVTLGLVATTNAGGAGKWTQAYTCQLKSAGVRHVVILPDNDPAGQAHAQLVATSCHTAGLHVQIVTLPDVAEKGDVSDYLNTHAKDDLLECVRTAPVFGSLDPSFDLATLLTEIETFIRRYVVITKHESALATLWIAHTHALAATDYTPYVHLTSPEPECGKSRFVEVVQPLVAKPVKSDSITRAALIRVMHDHPTLLLDELDSLLSQPELRDTLTGILNAGFHRSGTHLMCVGEGSKQELKKFPVFGPKILSGIGTLPRPLTTRTIPIQFKRRLKREAITKWRDRDGRAAAAPFHAALTAWATGAIATLRAACPAMPEGLRDRAEDVLEPLFSIADMAGEPWVSRARTAAIAVLGTPEAEDDSIGVQLLSDIRDVFGEAPPLDDGRPADALLSKTLREALHALEDRPWSSWGKAKKPITGQAIAWLLRPFGVVSAGDIRIDDKHGKGYRRASFEDAFARYIPIKAGQRDKPNKSGPEMPISEVGQTPNVTDAKTPISSMNTGTCHGVTVEKPDQEGQAPEEEEKAPWVDV